MMKINKYFFRTALMAGVCLALSSCTEEKILTVDQAGLPQASDYDIIVKVDQETNQFTLNISNPTGVYPIWKIYKSTNPTISTRDGYSDIITIAGDYDVEMQVGNRNGISEGVKTATIHIDNTLMDFTPYMRNLTDGSSKVWHIDADTPGHLGCGEPGTEGLNWWSATPNDKKDWGVYDNLMIFADNGGSSTGLYTYDPGESGTIYVNTGITELPPYSDYNTNDGIDYCAPAEVQADRVFTLGAEGTDLVLTFPKGTLFGYLPNIELYNEPKFKVNSITRNKIEVTCDNGGIAWHYILAPFVKEEIFTGFKYDSDFNMWRKGEVSLQSTWFADDNWGEIAAPEVSVSNESIKLHTPAGMGGSQWQGQVHVGTDIQVSSAETYDFSCFVTANYDSKVTVKVQMDGDDNTFFVADQQPFTAGGSCFYFSDKPGFDGTLKIAFDFGGNPDMDFEITNIVFKKHSDDDGTVLPSEVPDAPGPSVTWSDVDSDSNLWNSATVSDPTTWTADDSWSEITGPEIKIDGNYYELNYSAAPGGSQWQAQFAIPTDIQISAEKSYDYRVTIYSTCDISGVTVKSTDNADDNAFWSDGRHDIMAYEDNIIELVGATGVEMNPLKLVFDFAGVQAGATVVVKDIIIQEHQEGAASGGWVDVDSADNLWAGSDNYTTWTSPEDWSGSTQEPEITINGNSYSIYYPEAPGASQWQAQFALHNDQSFSGEKTYDFRVTINPTCDIMGVTVKPTVEDDDNTFWSDGRHDVYAYEDNVIELKGVSAEIPQFKLVFDFAGVQAGATVVVKDIIIQEHR